MQKALLRDVLRSQGLDQLTTNLQKSPLRRVRELKEDDDSEDELVGVTSLPGTPIRSQQTSRSASPTRASSRRLPGPLHIPSKPNTSDPLRAFPTDVSQRIFRHLSVADLAKCNNVCRKWSKSQTLNYVWFQYLKKDTFQDESLPIGKWTRRESKMNWRRIYKDSVLARDTEGPFTSSPPLTPSGYQTPREIKEEQWKTENEAAKKPGKLEMREMYKELGGRKPRTKGRLGTGVGGGGYRDRGGWNGSEEGGI